MRNADSHGLEAEHAQRGCKSHGCRTPRQERLVQRKPHARDHPLLRDARRPTHAEKVR